MPETTESQLTESEVADLLRFVESGALLLPLRVEGWHKSLTDGGHLIRHATGRTLATVEFVPVEIETGRPALDGNAPARAIVALLNRMPALIRDWRALQAEREWHKSTVEDLTVGIAGCAKRLAAKQQQQYEAGFEAGTAFAKSVINEREKENAALREQLVQAQTRIVELETEIDTKAGYL